MGELKAALQEHLRQSTMSKTISVGYFRKLNGVPVRSLKVRRHGSRNGISDTQAQ